MIYLVDFYGIDDYQHWDRAHSEQHTVTDDGQFDEEESHSDSTASTISLEDAVERHPSRAVEKLAAVLGLAEENFARFHERSERYKQRPQQPIEKRPLLETNHVGEDAKRAKIQARSSPQAPKPSLSIRHFMGQDSKSESHQSEETRLKYEDSAAGRAEEEALAKMRSASQPRTPSRPYSEGSPTVPNESPIVQGSVSGSVNDVQSQEHSKGSRKSGRKAK